jgi:glycosyltransferase involved in cell wall biosynthesis
VGRWAAGKGIENLLTVWEKASGLFPWTLLLVVNSQPPKDQQARIRKLGESVCVIVGSNDPLPYYQVSDLAILLSENEGLSNFLLEAMSSGLPLLTSYGAAIGSEERARTWGWLTDGRIDDILSVLQSIQAGDLASKGANARAEVLNAYSSAKVAEQYEALYHEAIV